MTRPVTPLIVVLAALALGAGAPADADADASKRKQITTPGYEGTRKAPKTRSTTPKPTLTSVGVGGVEPGLLVDAAGTAHMAWSDFYAPYAMHYCRLPRGARSCDRVTKAAFPLPSPPADGANGSLRPPGVVAYGDQLVLLQQSRTGGRRRARRRLPRADAGWRRRGTRSRGDFRPSWLGSDPWHSRRGTARQSARARRPARWWTSSGRSPTRSTPAATPPDISDSAAVPITARVRGLHVVEALIALTSLAQRLHDRTWRSTRRPTVTTAALRGPQRLEISVEGFT